MRNWYRRLLLFVRITWRPDGLGGKVSIGTAWEVARIIWSDR